jgi:hypothetical protein
MEDCPSGAADVAGAGIISGIADDAAAAGTITEW